MASFGGRRGGYSQLLCVPNRVKVAAASLFQMSEQASCAADASVTAPFHRWAASYSQALGPVWIPGTSEPNKVDGEGAFLELVSKEEIPKSSERWL